ncbi:MAG: serine hydrolase domain-containing protein, partial [Chitinophagales bacterium]
MLLERGLLCLDDRVDVFLPEFQGRPFGEATIRHLLTHTAGFSGNTALWQLIPERGSAARALAFLTPERRPGAQVEYSCAGYVLLGL